jgi:hypothetical protein
MGVAPHAEDVSTSSDDDNAVHNNKMADVRLGSITDIEARLNRRGIERAAGALYGVPEAEYRRLI